MVFNQLKEHMHHNNNSMMNWGFNMWLYMFIFSIIFLLVVISLIYILQRSTKNFEVKSNNIDAKNIQNTKISPTIESKSNLAYFCSNCGKKLDKEASKYCPYCGSELQ